MSIANRLRLAILSVALLGLALVTASASDRLTSRPKPKTAAVMPIAVGEEVRTGTGQRRRLVLVDGSILYVNQATTLKISAARGIKLTAGEVLIEAAPGKEPFVVDTPKRQATALGTAFAINASDKGTGVIVARGKVKVSETGKGERIVGAGQRLSAEGDKPESSPRASHLLDWTRDLMISAESPLVPASAHSGGSLVVVDPNGQEAKLSLRKYHIDVFIEDGFARTTIDQTYFNDTHSRLEGTFHFPLPADASLSRLAMYVEGIRMEGGMVERDAGRNIYETIVTKQQDPALLEWVDGSTFKMRVFPLEPRQEKRIILSYSQRLSSYGGQETYRFPAGHSLERVRDWSLHVQVKHGDKIAWNSPSHTLKPAHEKGDLLLDAAEKNAKLDRDIVLSLGLMQSGEQTSFSTMEHEGAKYLMVRHRPNLLQRGDPGRGPRDMVILFESSGDRDPLLARAQTEIVRGLLQNAEPEDTFAVLTAGTRQALALALALLDNAHLIGALDLGRGLSDAAALLKDGRNPHLIHVGSGIAAMGEQRQDVLVKSIPDGVSYVGIGVGRRWNRNFMKSAAEKSGGLFTQINPDEPISWRSFELASVLNSPRLLDVRVSDETKNRYLSFSSLVGQGEEICAIAWLDGKELPEKVTVRGRWQGNPVEFGLTVDGVKKDAGALPRTWTRLEIDRLFAEDAVKHKTAIVDLSKAMYVMSPFTSLLVLENEAMYQQFKVDRGRKDHWAIYDCPEKIPVVKEAEDGIALKAGTKPTLKQILDTIRERQNPSASGQNGAALGYPLPDSILPKPLSELRPEEGLFFGGAFTMDTRTVPLENQEIAFRGFREIGGSLTKRKPLPAGGVAGISFDGAFPAGHTSAINSIIMAQQNKQKNVGQLMKQFTEYYKQGKYLEAEKYTRMAAALDPDNPVTAAAVTLARTQSRMIMDKARKRGNEETFWRADQDAGSLGAFSDTAEPLVLNARNRAVHMQEGPGSLEDGRAFHDLISYVPGMNTSLADIQATLESEAAPSPADKSGKIDEQARKLFDKARETGWHSFFIPADRGQPPVTIVFDGQGRHVYERTLFPGIRERVVCDGTNLWNLYPDLHIGAKRSVSRFHRAAFSRLVPMALGRAEDYARGADLVMVGERTVAIVPHSVEKLKDAKGKPHSYDQVQFVFDAEGRLAEKLLVEMPAKKVLVRIVLKPDGSIQGFDAQGKETFAQASRLAEAKAPSLIPDLKALVVLPLPYRTRQHIVEARKLKEKRIQDLPFDDALALFAADFAWGDGASLATLFRRAFHGRDQRQLGFYVFLAAAGQNLDGQNLDVLSEHRDEPLAQYLALVSSPTLRQHALQWAAGSIQWRDGFLRHLAVTHALLQRWQNPKILHTNKRQRQEALSAALDYAEKHKNSHFGFTLLGLMTERAAEAERADKDAKDVREVLSRVWQHYLKTPGLEAAARYEQARALWKAGKREEGRKAFLTLYESARKQDGLLAIDEDFHKALLGDGKAGDEWNAIIRKTARELIEMNQRRAVLALAQQCWQLDDQPLALELISQALEGIKERKEQLILTVAAVESLNGNGQPVEAQRLLDPLLEDREWGNRADLWRLAAALAERREQRARQLECLERALDLEYRHRPEVMQLESIDKEYGTILSHLQNLGDAVMTLKVKPPEDFLARVVRTADRWRSLSRNGTAACETAARILRQLGEEELAWDYLTTPIGLQPGESAPWVSLAQTLRNQGDLKTADQAFASAYSAEPTNAQILWDRAQNLRQSGNASETKKLLRQLAEGTWQPRFQTLAAQARWQLEER